MEVSVPLTAAAMKLTYYMVFGIIILVELVAIALIQLRYQIKLGDTVLLGGVKPRRVIATLFGYEISFGDRNEE